MMKPRAANRTRVHMEPAPLRIFFHEQHMAVSTDEYIRLIFFQFTKDSLGIFRGPSANVSHPHT